MESVLSYLVHDEFNPSLSLSENKTTVTTANTPRPVGRDANTDSYPQQTDSVDSSHG